MVQCCLHCGLDLQGVVFMNERIKLLAEQAKKHALDAMIKITDKEQALKVYSESYDTKFAELIVQQCMNQVREQYLPVLEDEIMMKDTYWDGYVLCGVDSYVAIKEHFGVTE
jgi:hypothetical protein